MASSPIVLSGILLGIFIALIAAMARLHWFPLTDNQLLSLFALIIAVVGLRTWWLQVKTIALDRLEGIDGKLITHDSLKAGQVVHLKET